MISGLLVVWAMRPYQTETEMGEMDPIWRQSRRRILYDSHNGIARWMVLAVAAGLGGCLMLRQLVFDKYSS